MDRRARITAQIDAASMRGLEIGPLNRPIVTREMGPVEYVDRAARAELESGYSIGADDAPMVDVDHIWAGRSLLESVGGQRAYSYLVASHVIEHVPDMYGWLLEIAAVLEDGGVAVFAVPDKRYTFDLMRRTSSGSEFVDAYVRRLRRPDARQVFDCFHNLRDPHTGLDRDGREPTEAVVTEGARLLLEQCQRLETSDEYLDAHCWAFTPRGMAEALDLASRLDLLPFEIARLDPTDPGDVEFLLVLRRLPDGLSRDQRREAFAASLAALDLPSELEATAPDVAALEAGELAQARLAAMEASTSWRITAPTFARRLRGQPTSS